MKKILAIALVLTVALVSVFAVETRTSSAKLKYDIAESFTPNFIIAKTGETTATSEVTVTEAQFGTDGYYTFDILDKTKNNVKSKYYTLAASCDGWKRDNVAVEGKAISLAFGIATATDSNSTSTKDGENLKVTFADKAIDRSNAAVKVGTLTASWTAFATEQRIAGSYTATVTVSLTSN